MLLIHYSTPVGEQTIAISLSVCVCLRVCLSVNKHISGTAAAIFMKFFVQILCGGAISSTSDLAIVSCMAMRFWHCDTGQSLMFLNALFHFAAETFSANSGH